MRPPPGNDLNLGTLAGRNATLAIPCTERDKHLYLCGGTGTGKSKFLEHLIRQDMFGQRERSLDFGKALDEGSIILVCLATERAKISKENAELFATLLLSDLWTAAQERGKREGIKPFYVYLDEFQRFVTPTIADNLDEARGFGLHLTMAHQFPNQLLDRGDNGRRVYNSVMENASSKVVFRLSHEDNLRVMAQWLFTGVMNPDEIKHKLYSTKVMSYREELREIVGESHTSGYGHGTQSGHAGGAGTGGTQSFFDGNESSSQSWSEFSSASGSESDSWSESSTESRTLVPTLIPVFGKELAHVQFRSLEEQLFRAMAVLFDQKQRQGVARLVGMSAPVSLYTPTIKQLPENAERVKKYLGRCYAKLPFALRSAEAQKQLADRAENFADTLLKEATDESRTAKRRVR